MAVKYVSIMITNAQMRTLCDVVDRMSLAQGLKHAQSIYDVRDWFNLSCVIPMERDDEGLYTYMIQIEEERAIEFKLTWL